jgi:hypothetical protein
MCDVRIEIACGATSPASISVEIGEGWALCGVFTPATADWPALLRRTAAGWVGMLAAAGRADISRVTRVNVTGLVFLADIAALLTPDATLQGRSAARVLTDAVLAEWARAVRRVSTSPPAATTRSRSAELVGGSLARRASSPLGQVSATGSATKLVRGRRDPRSPRAVSDSERRGTRPSSRAADSDSPVGESASPPPLAVRPAADDPARVEST